MSRIAVATGLVALAVTALFMLVAVSNMYAQAITVTPNPVPEGGSFQVSGNGFAPIGTSGFIEVWPDAHGSCSGILLSVGVSTNGLGRVGPDRLSSSGLGVGTHCIAIAIDGGTTASSTFTVAATTTTAST